MEDFFINFVAFSEYPNFKQIQVAKKEEISERLGYTHGVDGMDLDHEITLKVHLLKLGL